MVFFDHIQILDHKFLLPVDDDVIAHVIALDSFHWCLCFSDPEGSFSCRVLVVLYR